ncbi:MAG: ParD-like family protein [Gammaproteobacteria bacterium]|nr:ParD-like family protein [Gammaproteobacteria bacterium]
MSHAIKISEDLFKTARIYSKTFHRSTAGQIEYWAKIGRIVEENPDLPYEFIQGILISLEELKSGQVEPYVFSGKSK